MLIESRVDHLDSAVTKLTYDTEALATGLKDLSIKVALMEGYLQGRQSVPPPKRLPRRTE